MTPVVPDFDHYPIQHLPTALQMTAEALVVTWDDGAESTYPLLWFGRLADRGGAGGHLG